MYVLESILNIAQRNLNKSGEDDVDVAAANKRCASCGVAEINDIKLMISCDDCDLVSYYCSDKCQEDHRNELRDEILFRQPQSSHIGDCPICCLPLSLDASKSTMYSCCSKVICSGCSFANQEMGGRLESCPFCRTPQPKSEEERAKRFLKRVSANDPVAISEIGKKHYKEGDYGSAFKYWTKGAELGNAPAHFQLAWLF